MKNLLVGVSAVALCAAAFGVTTPTHGVLVVPSSAAETIISVPWLQIGTVDSDITVSNLVDTANLNENDELMLYANSKFSCWILDANKNWVAGTTATADSISEAAAAAGATIGRGKALILKRNSPIADTIVLQGRPPTTSTGSMELPTGTSSAGVYALIAPPNVEDTNVNTGLTWSGLTANGPDRLIIDRGDDGVEILKWKGSYWASSTHKDGTGVVISAGVGAWFVAYDAGTGTKTVAW